jgi:CheY-like chemotaxis protein
VLVVDDDRMVAELTVGMLEELGHMGFIAASGRAALEILATGTKIDLVITDHAMPGMTGVDLATHIRQNRPDMPIILATGYADVGDLHTLGLPRLMKPYHLDALATVMGSVSARSDKMAS